jgi:uncharacterized DUF497 family protein
MIQFEWDEAKRASNLSRHKIEFEDLIEVLDSETATKVDDRCDYGEIRLLTLRLLNGQVIAIAHTETSEGNVTVIRIISARKAERNEQEYYFKKIRD